MSFTYQPLNARLSWSEDGLPWSEDYGDVYYSRADALGESTHVFLEGNNLPQRFANLQHHAFTIGELGFGAGLNFLNTCRLWCKLAPPDSQLHYLACELHPFTLSDLSRLQQKFPELKLYSDALIALYPDHTTGVHQLEININQHRITLTLLYADASVALEQYQNDQQFLVDAWFLDGFSPATNAALWHSSLFRQLALFNNASTTLSSYSVAGNVRKALTEAGFIWEKLPGFANKRHMLSAKPANKIKETKKSKVAQASQAITKVRTVCVIGGGLAGCSTAFMLARTGWQVILIERESELASQASGNPQGVLHCKPATVDSPDNRFNLHAYLYAARFYRALNLPASIWSACGMVQLAHDHKLAKRFATLAENGMYSPAIVQLLNSTQASDLCQIPITKPAMYFPDAGWLSPVDLCRFYCSHPSIHVLYGQELAMLDQDKSGWELIMHSVSGEQFMHAEHVVLCNSAEVHRFMQTRHIPVISNRGQVDIYPASPATAIDKVLCGQGYIIPASNNCQSIGGSFVIAADSEDSRATNTKLHLQQLADINPALAAALENKQVLQQRSATRCTMADRMPVVGAVATKNGNGLWINVAHGSNGLARTPISAALLASYLNNTPPPLAADLRKTIAAHRFKS